MKRVKGVKVMSKEQLKVMGGSSMLPGMSGMRNPMMFEELDYTIHLTGAVTEELIAPIIKQLQEIEEENFDETTVIVHGEVYHIENKAEPVKLYINTIGGSVDAGIALISQMRSMKTPVHTYILGYAYSMGLPIWLAGDRRFVSPHADIMFHNMYGGVAGSPKQVQKYSEYYTKRENMLFDLCMPDGLADEHLDKFIEAHNQEYDFYFTGEEAYEWGFATDIIGLKPKAKVLEHVEEEKEDETKCECEDCLEIIYED